MNTLEFLQRVLPSAGYYAFFAVAKGGRPQQQLYDSIEQLAEICQKVDQKGVDTYYGISSFKTKASRKQENVHATKVVPLDIDCGPHKPYATQKEGAMALLGFTKRNNLPTPLVVGSGGGIHAYWVLEHEVDPTTWQTLAEALKTACSQQNLYIDTGKTGDSACVLRPTGTHNYKLVSPRPVLLISEGKIVFESAFRASLSAFTVSKHSPLASPLLAALEVKIEYPPAEAGLIAQKCAQIADISAKRGNVDEPLWYAALGVAAYCDNPEFVAISWSNGHPGYNQNDTLAKMVQWRDKASGPTLCSKFGEIRPEPCKNCKFKGKISTPVRIGIQHIETIVAADAPDVEAHMVVLPKPFKRTATGIKVVIDDVEIDVCNFDIYPLGQGKDEHLGYEVARYKWNRPLVGWSLLELPVRDLAEGSRDFSACLGNAGIVPTNKIQSGYMSIMLRNFLAELNKTKPATNLYASMGWKEDGSEFVLGGTIYRKDTNNRVIREAVGLSRNAPQHILSAYTATGNPADWVKFTTVLDNASLVYYRFMLGTAFGCPLWTFCGLGGVVISLFGETGTGKTTIQKWIQSVYGNPEELLIPAMATQNATFSRLGIYNNLPATIDEMSVMPAKDTANFIHWAATGQDKLRLNKDSVERGAHRFSTMTIGSTNISLNAKLLSAGSGNTALSMRLLELNIPQHHFFAAKSEAGGKIHAFLRTNYGTAGAAYIGHLMDIGADRLRGIVSDSHEKFRTKYSFNFAGEERFWEHAIVLADLGNSIAKKIGLIDYDYEKGTEWVLEQIDPMRRNVKEQIMDCFDLLNKFLNDYVGNALTVIYTGTNAPYYDLNRIPRDEIIIRYNLMRKNVSTPYDAGMVYIDRAFFFKWLTNNGYDPRTTRQQLIDSNVVRQPKADKYYMGKDTSIRTGQTYVIGIDLATGNSKLEGILNSADAHTLKLVTDNKEISA